MDKTRISKVFSKMVEKDVKMAADTGHELVTMY